MALQSAQLAQCRMSILTFPHLVDRVTLTVEQISTKAGKWRKDMHGVPLSEVCYGESPLAEAMFYLLAG